LTDTTYFLLLLICVQISNFCAFIRVIWCWFC